MELNKGMEYEDLLMRNQQYTAEIERLTKELTATNDYLAECRQDIQIMFGIVRDITAERDEARKEMMMWLGERCSKKELKKEYKRRGWEYLREE